MTAANQSADETETSNDEIQTAEINLPKLNSGMAHVNQDKKPNEKGSNGAISKTTKKPTPAPKKAPNSNQSTPKTARKGTLIQNDLLNKFVNEAIDLEQRVDRKITAWKTSGKGSISLRKKTAANLECLREDLQDKLNDMARNGRQQRR